VVSVQNIWSQHQDAEKRFKSKDSKMW